MKCEQCGSGPSVYKARHIVDGVCVAILPHKNNRTRLDRYYADKAGYPELAGKMLCHACYTQVLDRVQ